MGRRREGGWGLWVVVAVVAVVAGGLVRETSGIRWL